MWIKFSEQVIQLHDKSFEVFIHEAEIQKEVSSLAALINKEYEGKDIVFVAILNGSFMFASDLMKSINIPCEISFVKVSSYQGTSTRGRVDELIGLNTELKGRHVVLLEDIVDTGITIDKIKSLLKVGHPESVKVCTLLFKPTAFKGKDEPEYVGFSIPNSFVVGYGLDYNEHGRNLRQIYKLKED